MSTTELLVRTVAAFIFNNDGPEQILPVLLAGLSIWTSVALAYVALKPEPAPLFFGVPAAQAHWHAKVFPRKWIALGTLVVFYFLFRVLYP